MTDEQNSDREDLEARIAFHEDTINTLNNEVATMGREIQDLQKQFHLLYKKVDDIVYQVEQGQNGPVNTVDERPPHY
ncbi:SlyX family protein [Teredinibacter franksiae]|uniref:SlyX family protein n=1 Tax=Teredinibacter franksiae TaxID=2761453 RepID=UPI0016293441|nr:SlyX family protein [Teredinibacter franksiae]